MSPRDTALAFLEAFGRGDVEALEPLLAESLSFRGPFLSCDRRDDYLAALRRDPPRPSRLELLEVVAAGDRVALLYRYLEPEAATTVAQFFRIEDARIAGLELVFDTRPFDARPAENG